jgi:hypothetical protein
MVIGRIEHGAGNLNLAREEERQQSLLREVDI